MPLIDHNAPPGAVYLYDTSRTFMSPMNDLYWALNPDPLIHSWRWVQKEKSDRNGIGFVWVKDWIIGT